MSGYQIAREGCASGLPVYLKDDYDESWLFELFELLDLTVYERKVFSERTDAVIRKNLALTAADG